MLLTISIALVWLWSELRVIKYRNKKFPDHFERTEEEGRELSTAQNRAPRAERNLAQAKTKLASLELDGKKAKKTKVLFQMMILFHQMIWMMKSHFNLNANYRI